VLSLSGGECLFACYQDLNLARARFEGHDKADLTALYQSGQLHTRISICEVDERDPHMPDGRCIQGWIASSDPRAMERWRRTFSAA